MGRRKQPLNLLQALPPETIALPDDAPRLEDDAMERMVQSLGRTGLRHPLLVLTLTEGRRKGSKPAYRLVVGRKRLLAALQLAWPTVDCIVLPPEAAPEAEVVTRLQEDTPPPWLLADTLNTLKLRYGWTQAQLGHAVDKTRDFVANYLPITRILPEVRAFLQESDPNRSLTARHLRFVGRTPPARQMRIAQRIVAQGLSTKSLEAEPGSRPSPRRYIKLRSHTLPGAGRSRAASVKEWRKTYRQIQTDLRRLERREKLEDQRARAAMTKARERLRAVRQEARVQRRRLERELRRVVRNLANS